MPLYQLDPSPSAISVEGVEFKPNENGLFALPAHGRVLQALAEHGFAATKVGDLEEELNFQTLAEQSQAKDSRIAALEAELARMRGETPAAARLLSPAAGGAASETTTGRAGAGKRATHTAVKDGATSTQQTGSGPVPAADTLPLAGDGTPSVDSAPGAGVGGG